MAPVKNVLFIMADQLRADYLGCAGLAALHTPHIDALAAKRTFHRRVLQCPGMWPVAGLFLYRPLCHVAWQQL